MTMAGGCSIGAYILCIYLARGENRRRTRLLRLVKSRFVGGVSTARPPPIGEDDDVPDCFAAAGAALPFRPDCVSYRRVRRNISIILSLNIRV